MKRMMVCLLMMSVTGLFCGCHRNEGPVERAGKSVDEAVDNVRDGESPFHKKGTAEKAGEAIDDAVDDLKGENH